MPPIYSRIGNNFQNVKNFNVNGVQVPVGTITIPLANPYDFWDYVGRVDLLATQKDNVSYRVLIESGSTDVSRTGWRSAPTSPGAS